ncbi:zinc ribbon domain-containing protein [Cohnella panacarvi]|uniref:zinc ribbon domain-containing protein n=1 Tax=Cohnella panacarvi TaxID=400776 RepID=UPI00047B00EF|nr:zinc ribbon domain-containing protein [Cohnella panacarvi]
MQCNSCGQTNPEGSKFCVKCGASIETAAAAEAGQAFPHLGAGQSGRQDQPSQPNPQLEQIKQVSSQYWKHFVQTLKQPTRIGETTNESNMVNGIITMVLFSLMLPLIVYFTLKNTVGGLGFGFVRITFGDYVLKPLIFLLIVAMMVNSLIFFALKLGNVVVSYREVIGRFGAYLIPSTAIMTFGVLLSLLELNGDLLGWVVLAGIFSWMLAVSATIYSYRNRHKDGLDPFYGILGTFAGSLLLLYLFGDNLLSVFFNGMGNIL